MPMTLTSTAFTDGKRIPPRYTCDDEDVSPPLAWRGVPDAAESLVLICDDPDAPDPAAPKRTWVHWVLFNLPPDTAALPEDVLPDDLPNGTRQGANDWNRTGYGGPCPPVGTHRYFFKLYALDRTLDLPPGSTKQQVVQAMKGHVLAEAHLMGRYER